MKAVRMCLIALALAAAVVVHPAGQGEGSGRQSAPPPLPGEGELKGAPVTLDATKPHDQNLTLDIVEVIGCVSEGPNNSFLLTNATAPVKGGSASTTPEALKAAAGKPLGTQRYVLIGATEWNPAAHKAQKVAVRGLIIKDAKETRLNVTSLQKVGDTCAK